MNKSDEGIYFVDGCVIRKGYIYMASRPNGLDMDRYDFTRMMMLLDGKWLYHDLNWDVASVCCWKTQPATACALSAEGDVCIVTSDGFAIEKIPNAGTEDGIGSMMQIRPIAASVYACGFNGQVYNRSSSGRWSPLGGQSIEGEFDACGLDGISENDIYVVGLGGKIYHWEGKSWRSIKSPARVNLVRVRCASPDEVYICGDHGTLLRGNYREGFKILNNSGAAFWGLEFFEQKVYLAAERGLSFFNGEEVAPVVTGLDPEIEGYRLDARDGVLWSFGFQDLAFFDGKTWTRVQHPDNPPR